MTSEPDPGTFTVLLGVLFTGMQINRSAISVEKDKADIRSAWGVACAALCAGDWPRYRSLWARTAEVELLHPAGSEWLTGWDTIVSFYEGLIASGFRCTVETTRMQIRIAEARDIAWASAGAVLSAAGVTESAQRTWYTLVFRREGEEWQLVHAHASVPAEP